MGKDAISRGQTEGEEHLLVPHNLSITELNNTSSLLAEVITDMAKKLKGNRKTKTSEKSQILNRLMKSYADLVKTHRAVNGLDQQVGSISAGVIIIPGKARDDDWVNVANQELDSAKQLLADVSEPITDNLDENEKDDKKTED